MPDRFQNNNDTPVAPATAPFAIVPDDVTPLPNVPKGIYVGGGGTITLRGVAWADRRTSRTATCPTPVTSRSARCTSARPAPPLPT